MLKSGVYIELISGRLTIGILSFVRERCITNRSTYANMVAWRIALCVGVEWLAPPRAIDAACYGERSKGCIYVSLSSQLASAQQQQQQTALTTQPMNIKRERERRCLFFLAVRLTTRSRPYRFDIGCYIEKDDETKMQQQKARRRRRRQIW